MLIKEAPVIWDSLRSIICVYKPSNTSVHRVRSTIINAICTDLNQMSCRPPTAHVTIAGRPRGPLVVRVAPSLADHPLVAGPRYQHADLRCAWANHLGRLTSGVLLLGLRGGTRLARRLREARPTRAFLLAGRLGAATVGGLASDPVAERAAFAHVRRAHLDAVLAAMQAAHQRAALAAGGLDARSHAAFALAAGGPARPADGRAPAVFGLRCVGFEPPRFLLEAHCANEYEAYLVALVQEVGVKVNSAAHCTGIKCVRHGHFTIADALLGKHWRLQHILDNMAACDGIIERNEGVLWEKRAHLH